MERRSFLKSLGILSTGLVLKPKLALSQLEEPINKDYDLANGHGKNSPRGKFVNHMSIQRKIYGVTGGKSISSPDNE